jgi:hypothetical protein
MIPIRETAAGVLFKIRVVPRASRAGVAGFQQDALKLRITDPPVEGQANEGCIRLLAEALGVKRSQLAIVAGHASRSKTVAVTGITAAALTAALTGLTDEAGEGVRG